MSLGQPVFDTNYEHANSNVNMNYIYNYNDDNGCYHSDHNEKERKASRISNLDFRVTMKTTQT